MRFRTKGFTSLLISLAFSIVVLSGVALYVSPKGRVANWTGWTLFGLDKHQWGALHINICLLFLAGAFLHLFFNWKVFLAYIKNRTSGLNLKVEMVVALLVTAVVVTGTWLDVPPFTAPVAVSDQIKDYWEAGAPQGPAPHAEEFTIARFATQLGLDVDQVAEALRTEGYDFEDNTATVADLARQKGTPPSSVFADLRKHFPDVKASQGLGLGRGMGRGMGMGRSQGRSDHSPTSDTAALHDGPQQSAEGDQMADDRQDHPGSGPGQGRGDGQGRGAGLGQGQGRGLGGGQGRGLGGGQGRGQGGGQGRGLGGGPAGRVEGSANPRE